MTNDMSVSLHFSLIMAYLAKNQNTSGHISKGFTHVKIRTEEQKSLLLEMLNEYDALYSAQISDLVEITVVGEDYNFSFIGKPLTKTDQNNIVIVDGVKLDSLLLY